MSAEVNACCLINQGSLRDRDNLSLWSMQFESWYQNTYIVNHQQLNRQELDAFDVKMSFWSFWFPEYPQGYIWYVVVFVFLKIKF